jgi:hypothetical protein
MILVARSWKEILQLRSSPTGLDLAIDNLHQVNTRTVPKSPGDLPIINAQRSEGGHVVRAQSVGTAVLDAHCLAVAANPPGK